MYTPNAHNATVVANINSYAITHLVVVVVTAHNVRRINNIITIAHIRQSQKHTLTHTHTHIATACEAEQPMPKSSECQGKHNTKQLCDNLIETANIHLCTHADTLDEHTRHQRTAASIDGRPLDREAFAFRVRVLVLPHPLAVLQSNGEKLSAFTSNAPQR